VIPATFKWLAAVEFWAGLLLPSSKQQRQAAAAVRFNASAAITHQGIDAWAWMTSCLQLAGGSICFIKSVLGYVPVSTVHDVTEYVTIPCELCVGPLS
jgi:hypothetical protein